MTEAERNAFNASFRAVPIKPREFARDERGFPRFRVVGTHPHSGRECVVPVDENDTVAVHDPLGMGWRKYLIEFTDDEGGSAFANKENLQPIWAEPEGRR